MRKVIIFGSGVKTTRVPQAGECPSCYERLDAASSTEGQRTPRPGDFSVCAMCGEMLRYGPGMELRSVTEEDWDEVRMHEGLRYKLESMSRMLKAVRTKMTTPGGPAAIVLAEIKPKKK